MAHGKRVNGSSRAHSWSNASIIKMAFHSPGYSILQDSFFKTQSIVFWELMYYETPAWSAFPGSEGWYQCLLCLWGSSPTKCHHHLLCRRPFDLANLLPLPKFRDRHVPLPCYWPKQSDGLSTSRSLCSLPLRAGQKTSICSSTSVQKVATEDTAKHGFSDTQSHTGLLLTISACQCYQMINKPF